MQVSHVIYFALGLKFAFFKRTLTAQKYLLQQLWWRRKEEKKARERNIVGSLPVRIFIFYTWSKSDHCKIRLNATLTSQKSDMNQSMIQ